jgi:glycosyltransferase involved in cell wall biosynthesis
MRIVVVSDWYAEKMGYSENMLPKALAKLGAEVHVVTSNLQPTFPNYEAYESFIGPRLQPAGLTHIDGFTLHRLVHGSQRLGIYIKGFYKTLKEIQPDIVQCFVIHSLSTYQSVISKLVLNYRLFLEEHVHWSVFEPPKSKKTKAYFMFLKVLGKMISASSECCYPIAPNVARIAVNYLGYSQRKLKICSLGVDTDLFAPIENEVQIQQRRAFRKRLGFDESDIVCVYSGRFHSGKNPLCLAQAIKLLRKEDERFKGLFIGSGTTSEVEAIKQHQGCVIHPFVEHRELVDFYRAADIGVWPKQESTSQLDLAACGLPIILSNRVETRERVDGNGFVYEEDDPEDLARQIHILSDSNLRDRMGKIGSQKMRDHFSWSSIAKQRLQDYETALQRL